MPGVDGVEATRRIMAESPCPIVVVTSSVSGHLGRVYEAMGHGALDAVDTPSSAPRGDLAGAPAPARQDRDRRQAGRPGAAAGLVAPAEPAAAAARPAVDPSWPLVAIGSSTGGPGGPGRDPLGAARRRRDAATVIVQHVDAAFAPGLARWLAERTGRRVELVEPGDRPLPGQILLAATNDHVDPRRVAAVPLRRRAGRRPLPPVGRRLLPERGRALARARRRGPADRDGPRRRRRPAGPPPGRLADDRPGRGDQRHLGDAPAPPSRSAPPTWSCPSPRSPGRSSSGSATDPTASPERSADEPPSPP